jgi:hypothetical protein
MSEDRGQMTEVGRQRSEDRGRMTEDRGRKTEVRGQITEDGLRVAEIGLQVWFVPATLKILLHLPPSDVLLYALSSRPFLPATCNP